MFFRNASFQKILLPKRSLQITGVIIASLMFQSCGEFLKGKPKTQDVVEIKTQEIECMKEVKKSFEKLFNSETTDLEIDQSFQCLQKTLDLFQKNAEGRKNPDSFTSEELFKIFDKFFKDAAISQKATEDILILKKALFGGEVATVTKVELGQLKEYLKVLHVEIKKLAPYAQVFKLSKKQGVFDQATVDQAFTQLNMSLKTLLKSSKIGRSEYSITDLKELIVSLNVATTEEDQKQIELIENVIKLIAGEEVFKTNEHYAKAIDSFTQLGRLYAQAIYTDMKFEISNSQQLNRVFKFVEDLIETLENTPQFVNRKQIPLKYIDPIISEVLKSQVFPLDVSEPTFMAFYKTIMIRIFNDQKNIAVESLTDLKQIHIKNLKREFYIYRGFQKFIDSLDYKKSSKMSVKSLQQQVLNYKFNMLDRKFSDQTLPSQIVQGLLELRDESLAEYSILFNDKKMILSKDVNKSLIGWEDLSRALYTKMLGRELLIGWGNLDPQYNLKKSYLTESGMIQWYADFRDFGIETKLFDKREINSGAKSFLEANLFTSYGNGDQQLNFYETLQFVSMLLSGGGEITNMIISDMKDAGCRLKSGELDVFGNPWLEEKCFKNRLRQKHSIYFSNLKNYSVYVNSLTDAQFHDYYNDLMLVARNDATQVGRIETADIRILSMLIMYIESLYGRYDTRDKFQMFNPAEIRQSYPRFKAFVADFAQKEAQETVAQWDSVINVCGYFYTKDDLFREAFIFMVYTGRLPVLQDMNYVTCAINGLFTFEGEVDRKTIISTFKVLKSVLASKK